MTMREKFITRSIELLDETHREIVRRLSVNAPTGIEVVFREKVKARKPDQNALMWVGPLNDISEQAWIDGCRFSDKTWHEHFKREFLPEADDPDLAELVKKPETYRKWDITPGGDRVCVGSTTELTIKGFSQYLEQVYAAGAQHGVRFSAKEEK